MSFKKTIFFSLFLILFSAQCAYSQITFGDDVVDYAKPREYTIGGIEFKGVQYLDNNILLMISGLSVGQKINVPGEEISDAIKKFWKQGLFEVVEFRVQKIQNGRVFLEVYLQEQPKLSKFSITGLKKTETDELKEQLGLVRGDAVNQNVLQRTKNRAEKYFVEKGFQNVKVEVKQIRDTNSRNEVTLIVNVNKGKKVKIVVIEVEGNKAFASKKIKRKLKETKEKKIYRFWKPSRYIQKDFDADKVALLDFYNSEGFRDARIVSDSVIKLSDKLILLKLKINEGNKYFLGDVNWIGNTKYTDEQLAKVFTLKKGDVYNQKLIDTKLFMDMEVGDVQSLYMDRGYLFSSVTPVEAGVRNDTIDLEIRIYEGKQATVKRVIVKGNTKTHDEVILREIRTKPGQLFNRADIIRTQRELAQLGYFDPEKLGVVPKPNPLDGTVDIEYTVEETSSDQIEMSLGWGYNTIIGTVGVSFNNFSARDLFNKSAWAPIPSGAGQKLSLRMQSNGVYYQSYSASFTEPWLGGKKPNALSFSAYHSVQSNGVAKGDDSRYAIEITGISVGLGKRLRWPDDLFTLYTSLGYQHYNLDNYSGVFTFSDGYSNNVSLTMNLGRNSTDQIIYPRSGSDISLSAQATPPYYLFRGDVDYSDWTDQQKFLWLEYYKIKFNFSWFTALGNGKITSDLVFHTRAKFGFLGAYNNEVGVSPFERFYLGGDGLTGYSIDGRELVGMRGYTNSALSDDETGATVFNKFTFELRYPISKNPMATVFFMTFVEAGNSWSSLKYYNPFDLYRSAGVGARIYLPMFGLLGLDWGYGFDQVPGSSDSKSQFHFSINGSID